MTPGCHGSTFGGNPLACAVANGVLDVVLEEGFLEHVRAMAERLRASSIVWPPPSRAWCRRFAAKACCSGCAAAYADISAELMTRGMLTVPAGENVLRLLPPLIIEQRHIDEAIGKLQDVLQEFAGREAAQ